MITIFNRKPQFTITCRKILKKLMILKLFQGKNRDFVRTRVLSLYSALTFTFAFVSNYVIVVCNCFSVSISILFSTLVPDHSFHSILFSIDQFRYILYLPSSYWFTLVPISTLCVSYVLIIIIIIIIIIMIIIITIIIMLIISYSSFISEFSLVGAAV